MPLTSQAAERAAIRLTDVRITSGDFSVDRTSFFGTKKRALKINFVTECGQPKRQRFGAQVAFDLVVSSDDEGNEGAELLTIKGGYDLEFETDKGVRKKSVAEYQQSRALIDAVWPFFLMHASDLVFKMNLPRLPLPPTVPFATEVKTGASG